MSIFLKFLDFIFKLSVFYVWATETILANYVSKCQMSSGPYEPTFISSAQFPEIKYDGLTKYLEIR